ncbi:MAG: hypothetical protein AMJ81_06670 [Phycisphaerae bacterium SM23_33]|nr:MAG: hypothetical protein AMJ81_06670 [Phycisphaerae bacterium SM23_33]
MEAVNRRIIHVDMDEFFAAVEKLDRPQLRGRPILVGGDPAGRGGVSTASYEARAFGCRSAMPMVTALRLCPEAVVLPVRGERYREVSDRVFEILERFTPVIEPVSIDEAFLDVAGCERLLGPAEGIARRIKADIPRELGLTASVGLAPNKFLAKLASDLQKPDGLVVLTERNVHEVLDPLGIEKLWGVGPAAAEQLKRLNIHTIGQLRRTSAEGLTEALGQLGEHLLQLANGQDDRPVTPDSQAKSIGQEQTFAQDLAELDELRRVLLQQTEQVGRRLRRHGLKARTIRLKLRYGDFTTLTRSQTLPEPTDVTQEIWGQAEALLLAWARRSQRPLRLLGVTAAQLVWQRGQLPLFEEPERLKQRRLDQALDEIADRFGDEAVRRGPPDGAEEPQGDS